MAKKAATTKRLTTGSEHTGDFMEVGQEVVPGMRLRCICRGHTESIGRIAWSPCGRFIASPSKDKTIRIWDANDGQFVKVLEQHEEVCSTAWSPDGAVLASGDYSGTIKFWDVATWHNNSTIVAGSSSVSDMCWAPDGSFLATSEIDGKLQLLSFAGEDETITLVEHGDFIDSLAWASHRKTLVWNSWNKGARLWNKEKGITKISDKGGSGIAWISGHEMVAAALHDTIGIYDQRNGEITILEGPTSGISRVSASSDGRVLAVKSNDDSIRLWRTDSWELITKLTETWEGLDKDNEGGGTWPPSLAFHPTLPILATLGSRDRVLRIWDLRLDILCDVSDGKTVRYTSAKIVLVGESNVGKSCLAMRLAEDRYPDDHEHGTTHGMRFWPMEAEALHPAAKPPEGQRRDVVLWDFGGQDEYQLVHQMFLHDTTLALVLIDPTRGRAALDEARDWNKRLEKHLGKDQAVKLLIGAKVDDARKKNLLDPHGIDGLCKECGFVGFLDLSARTGRNTKQLRKLISDALDWDQMAKTSRPELFQHIRDDVEARRKRNEIVLTLDALKRAIKKSASKLYEEAAVEAVSDQLATQGIIVRTRLSGGDDALVLQLPVIERYAGSLIIAARNNARGVPVLEERLLSSTRTIPLPGMTKRERLSVANERMVLECIVELMIEHGICFRHGGLLVFPTLFPASGTDDEKLPHSISLYYDFTGAIDNIYASLVSKLMVSEEFGEGRLRAGRVEFESSRQGVCGVRQIKRTGGLAHVDLFFSEQTKPDRKDLFTRFVEEHLRLHGVDIREHEAMTCKCGEQISERIVQTRISAGEKDVVCPICERKTLIGEGAERIRKRNPETDAKMVALRKRIDEKLTEDIKSAKKVVAGEIHMAKTGDPIRILHLSDLHFTDKTNPETKLRLLLQDIRQQDEQYAAIDTVEYLVISGDMTDRGQDSGFEKARRFVELLVSELGLSFERCIFVPGNHDVQDRADAYEEREGVDGKPMLVRHPENFQKRFLPFSNGFFHPVMHKEYPLRYADQGISFLYPETGIQFLTLNSAWEIDKNGRKKAGMHPDAVASVISNADDERKRAIARDDLKKNQPILRIGVWHHAVAGPELMPDLGFLTQLQKAEMRLCLHGDVHELRTELFGHRKPGIEVEILGAGSFGSTAEGRPESTPKLYNMLEVVIDPGTRKHKSIRVHTRQQKKENEAWQGCHEWPNPKGGRISYFDIVIPD